MVVVLLFKDIFISSFFDLASEAVIICTFYNAIDLAQNYALFVERSIATFTLANGGALLNLTIANGAMFGTSSEAILAILGLG